MSRKADGAAIEKQEEIFEKACHGLAACASVLDQLLMGKGPFAEPHEKLDLENNREGNKLRSDTGKMLELKSTFHCKPSDRYIVHEGGFTRDALATTKAKRWSGRATNEKALDVIANYKHALCFYHECKQATSSENPSGLKLEDMVDHILKKMHVFLKGKKVNGGNAEEVKGIFTEENMPAKCIFTGYFTFVLCGPQPLSNKSLTCLASDSSNVSKVSRSENGKEAAKVKKAEREAAMDPSCNRRGANLTDKASAAHLANADHHSMLKHIRKMLVIHNSEHSLLLNELKEVISLYKETKGTEMEDEAKVWLVDVKSRIGELKLKRKELHKNEEKIRLKGPKKQVLAHFEQVGDYLEEKTVGKSVADSFQANASLENSKSPFENAEGTFCILAERFNPL